VLLAEDHPTNRRVVELILDAAGVDLTCVENGAEAVDAAAAGGFDLILMDMQMPVMDGLTATRAIRDLEAARGLPRTPIVSLTANAMPEHAKASVQSGADGHLTKPISAEALLRAVAGAAAGQPDIGAERREA
jgi:CheY-like chemotaxis protein